MKIPSKKYLVRAFILLLIMAAMPWYLGVFAPVVGPGSYSKWQTIRFGIMVRLEMPFGSIDTWVYDQPDKCGCIVKGIFGLSESYDVADDGTWISPSRFGEGGVRE